MWISMLCLLCLYIVLYHSFVVKTGQQCNYVSKYLLYSYSYFCIISYPYNTHCLYDSYSSRNIVISICSLNTICNKTRHTSYVTIEAHRIKHTAKHYRESATSFIYAHNKQRLRCVQSEPIFLFALNYNIKRRG